MISFQLTTGNSLLDGLHNSLKSLRIVHSEVGQHFAVEADVLLGQAAHQLGIAEAVLTGSGIDALDPQGAEFALLGLAVTVGVGETFFVGVLGYCPDVLAGQEVAAGFAENLLAACP